MYTDVMDKIKESLEEEFEIVRDSGISVEISDRGGYHYVISCIPKSMTTRFVRECKLVNKILACEGL